MSGVKEAEEVAMEGGELLFCGTSCWEHAGKSGAPPPGASKDLLLPTRLTPLVGISIRSVAAGCASNHCVALDIEGHCYTWGRNDRGQLGHGDLVQRDMPTVVSGLSKYNVIKAASGRAHTVIIAQDGISLAFGWNKHGQLGTGSLRNEVVSSPAQCHVTNATYVACGTDFTVWLSSVSGSSILTAGLPQYGQLGHGTDNEYNAKDSSVKLVYEPQPQPRAIVALSEKTITKVACGSNHSVAVDSNGYVYTWGFGGHGRLGHREQKDEYTPRLVEIFQRQNVLPSNAVVAAGSAYSACTAGGGQLYMWGRVKTVGDSWMYPKPLFDLSGWNIRCLDFGFTHNICGADDSCIGWGTSQHGELGFGPMGPKSSSNPKKIDILEGMHVMSVACGYSHSLIVVDRKNMEDRIEKLEMFECKNSTVVGKESNDNATKNESGKASQKKRKASSVSASEDIKSRKQPRKIAEEDDDSETQTSDDQDSISDDDESEPSRVAGPGSGRGRGRGRGRGGRGRGKSNTENETPKATRGRGRPRGGRAGKT